MVASATYRKLMGGKSFDMTEKFLCMLMWFVMGAGISAAICKAVELGRWFEASTFNRTDYLTFAVAFVLGFIVYSGAYRVVDFFVEGGASSRRIA